MKLYQSILYTFLISGVLGGKAAKIKSNPADIIAIADFPGSGDKSVKGNIVFTAKQGKFVNVHVDMTGLPKEGGPFQYHIHEFAVPENGDCEAAGKHFNPYNASPNCDAQKNDAYCQVGDLSGKHGWIDTTCFETKYDDKFLSLNGKSKSNILGRAVVFHYDNLTKFACANIEVADSGRIQNLQVEYAKNGNNDLQEVTKFVSSNNYQFHENEVLEADDETEELQNRDLVSPTGKHNHTDTDDDDCDNKVPTNYTNATLNGVSTDCENGSSSFGLTVLTAGLGIMAGLLF